MPNMLCLKCNTTKWHKDITSYKVKNVEKFRCEDCGTIKQYAYVG